MVKVGAVPDDRRRIAGTTARRLIDSQFPAFAGLALSPVEPQGWDNTTFRLGSGLKVRFPTASRYAAQAAKEAMWLPRLAAHLPVAVPTVVGLGEPDDGFPMPWSVQDWIPGEPATRMLVPDQASFARDVAGVLAALQRVPGDGAPLAGDHSFHRGGDLAVYDAETRACVAALGDGVDGRAALAVWEAGLAAAWTGRPAWVHGDVAPGNLLVRDGRLAALIDFGCAALGDPACDLVIAWTYLAGDGRREFRKAVPADDAMWARARGWALWKALLTLTNPDLAENEALAQRRLIATLIAEAEA